MNRNGNEIIITDEESRICLIDGKKFESNRKMIWHVRKTYHLNFEQYILRAYYDDIVPRCLKTNILLKFKANKLGPWYKNYTKNCFPRNPHNLDTKQKIKKGCEKTTFEKYGVKNVFSADWCKEKIKKTMVEKYGVKNIMLNDEIKNKVLKSFLETIEKRPKKICDDVKNNINRTSSLELDLQKKLNELNIKYESPFIHEGKRYDFYIPEINLVIELDGTAFHKDTLEKLTLITLNNSVNDYSKNQLIKDKYDFYRIRYDNNKFTFDETDEFLKKLNECKYLPNYNITYKQKIVLKNYFKKYIDLYGKDKLKKYVSLFLKFIRTFQKTFPYPDLKENINDIKNEISKLNVDNVYNKDKKEFSNNISNVGVNYLKHHFKSYWKSSFNGSKSPEEAWFDNKIMYDVISYRIGCNNSNEIFDFSLHQLIRGLSARRICISFFKPLLAATIYKHYIGDKQYPIVLDPCCGFGGRLLGFKSIYPNGIYIGCEPNVETYNELLTLKNNSGWDDCTVKLYNCKFEDFIDEYHNYDLIFTSIPYYDLEIYSNHISYDSFEHWKDTFIKSILKYKTNCYINMSEELSNQLNLSNIDSYIVSNRSHFDSKNGLKKEVIVHI